MIPPSPGGIQCRDRGYCEPCGLRRTASAIKRMVQIPYGLEQNEDGTWAAHASFPSGGAHGLGNTPEDAVADLYKAVSLVIEEFVAAL